VLYLATAWAYDSGYESAFVSRNTAAIPCFGQPIPRNVPEFRIVPRQSSTTLRAR
jgi:hypothetical protein